MESTVRARIAALAEAAPALADDLRLRGALIELVDRAEVAVPELRLPADVARARLAAGVPLLDRLDVPVPAAVARLLERLTVAMLAEPSLREPAEAMLGALRSHRLHGEQLVGEVIVGHDDHLEALAASADVPARFVVIVAELAARAVLGAVAERLRPALALGAWDRVYCPLCGGFPVLGERVLAGAPLTASGGSEPLTLRLRCSRCASAWAHVLRRCLDCGTGAFNVLEIEDDLDLGGWQIAACDTCPEYLKIAPSPRSERLGDLLVDDLETWGLDRWALGEGLQRRGGVGYRLEHGYGEAEGLDDD